MVKRVFISFHMKDRYAKELLVAQAKSDKFDLKFINYAINEPFDNKWKTQCRERINQCSIVICLIGKDTYQREAVIWELNTAYELNKKVFGIRIYRDKNHLIPSPLKQHNAKIITWDIKNIVKELESD